MGLKDQVKKVCANVLYALYRKDIFKNRINVLSVDETLDVLINTNKSMVRFGDGEATMMRGRSNVNQKPNAELAEDLKRIVGYEHEDLIVTIPDIFGDLSIYKEASQDFWKDHLMVARKIYYTYCNTKKSYYNTSVSRFYCTLSDQSKCAEWAEKIKKVFEGKDLIIVEGPGSHNGVGNDLFKNANSVRRIIGPSHDAYKSISTLFDKCCEFPKDVLVLTALGAPAKPLVERLFLEGYRVIDIGNLDLEYEWFLMKATKKVPLPKYKIMSEEENVAAGYQDYLDEIVFRYIDEN